MRKDFLTTNELVICSIFASLIAIGAFIKVPVPYVPFTMQVLFVNLTALLLGGRKAFISVMIYILVGLAGFPVFAKGGSISYVFQPTFGYLLGFAAGAYVAGRIANQEADLKKMILASLANIFIIYLFGLPYFHMITKYYLSAPKTLSFIMYYCCLMFLPGDLLSCAFTIIVGKQVVPVIKSRFGWMLS